MNKRLKIMFSVVLVLLLIPLIAMQFSEEVSWTVADFVVMAVLLLGAGLLVELVMRKVAKVQHRIFLFVAILIGFLVVWAELAVGIFGTAFAGN